MPTGYTDTVKDGISFEQFALGCAKAFGACISMRDLPSHAPIPEEFEASTYHAKKLAEARETLLAYEGMSIQEASQASRIEYREAEKNRKHRLQENLNQLECYRGMLEQVHTWTAPSEEHNGLKEFMLKQLRDSLAFDDSTKYLSEPTPLLSAADWLGGKKSQAIKDIEYHKQHDADEIKRTAERNLWVRQLRESLK